MFYYLSIISYIALAPLNIPVQETSTTGGFPEMYMCEVYKAQVENMFKGIPTVEIKLSKCVEKIKV
jgi:hypothetical protein